jgi:hypothetical protein
VTPPDYEYLRKLLKDHSGLDLSADKQYLIESRLLPLSRKCGVPGIGELVQKMKGGSSSIIAQVVEAMTTNETFFFRDKVPFDHFRDAIMPEMLKARASRKSIRIWCAAGSTGQEPYSLAMSLKEMGPALAGWRVEIIATDLSTEVLEKSKSGVYSQFEVQRGLPIQLLVKYFKQNGELWQVSPELRQFYLGQVRPFLGPEYRGRDPLASRPIAEGIFAMVRSTLPAELVHSLGRLAELCEERRQLALQASLHRWLHGWLLVHIPASVALLVLGIVHAVVSLYY